MELSTFLQGVKTRVENIIFSDARFPFFSPATLLGGTAHLYGAVMRIRAKLYQHEFLPVHRLPCAVVSIGNLTVGGTGKTPLTLYLANLLQQYGRKSVIVSRGYQSQGEKKGAVVCNGRSVLCNARQAGDEPVLMAGLLKNVPVVVGRDRYEAGLTALQRFQPDVILLDDAFQHLRLKRDLNLLLLDCQRPFGNKFVLPRGPLREPLTAFLRADAIVVTRCTDTPGDSQVYDYLVRMVSPRPVFRCMHVPLMRCAIPSGDPVDSSVLSRPADFPKKHLRGRKVFAFAALAHNQNVWRTICEMGADLQGAMGFDDHHPYSLKDINQIAGAALKMGSDCLVTTEKDLVRIPQNICLPLDLIVLGIAIDFKKDQNRFERFIASRVLRKTPADAAN